MAGSPNYRGSILVNNAELRDIAPESLYEIMSVIQQAEAICSPAGGRGDGSS